MFSLPYKFLLIAAPAHAHAHAHAHTTFETTCTVPNVITNFVSSPDTRGTLDILWSCLFTILACTWTVQHLNIPEQRGDKDEGWRGDIKWKLKGFWSSLKWMLATAIAPELLLAKNMGDLLAARRVLPRLQRLAAEDRVPWTLTHTLFVEMGGFMIRGRDKRRERDRNGDDRNITDIQYSDFAYLTSWHLINLRESGILPHLPNVSKEDINDKSKSDMFARLVAIAQITWIALQVIVRAAKGLAISQLEIAVLAFSSCAILIYVLNWEKPKEVKVPYFVLTYDEEISPDIKTRLKEVRREYTSTRWVSAFLPGQDKPVSFDSAIPNDCNIHDVDLASRGDLMPLGGLLLGFIIFGGIHVAAWNFEFPTHVEQLLWRVTSLWCMTALIMNRILSSLAALCFFFIEGKIRDKINSLFWQLFIPMTSVLYVLARLFLMVETFRTLCFLPPDAYISTWATNFPHLA